MVITYIVEAEFTCHKVYGRSSPTMSAYSLEKQRPIEDSQEKIHSNNNKCDNLLTLAKGHQVIFGFITNTDDV